MLHDAHRAILRKQPLDLPAVGDWVALRPSRDGSPALIHAVVPRRNRVARRAAGEEAGPQILAANVDVLLVVMALDGDFNPRRLERYTTLGWESEAVPLVVLTKSDVCEDVAGRIAEARTAAPGAEVLAVSAVSGTGFVELASRLGLGRTHVLVGMSGVGKSSLVNRLLGEEAQAVRDVRTSDGRGRHTTTRRDLFLLPGGALLVDTPGMRELALWDGPGRGATRGIPEASARRGLACTPGRCRPRSSREGALEEPLARGEDAVACQA